jgi:hypothetical protein
MNKKGAIPSGNFVWAIILAVIILIFLVSGGIITVVQITQLITKIPSWVWIFIGALFLIKMLFGKK